jgi:hypothetical protein
MVAWKDKVKEYLSGGQHPYPTNPNAPLISGVSRSMERSLSSESLNHIEPGTKTRYIPNCWILPAWHQKTNPRIAQKTVESLSSRKTYLAYCQIQDTKGSNVKSILWINAWQWHAPTVCSPIWERCLWRHTGGIRSFGQKWEAWLYIAIKAMSKLQRTQQTW